MIVYLKNSLGEIYATPIFAEFGDKSWQTKCVILDENGKNFVLIPVATNSKFNFFFIDDKLDDGWQERESGSGFSEILDDKALISRLNKGEKVEAKGSKCLELYNLPIKPIFEYDILSKDDVDRFLTVCWGLHDAEIEKIERQGNDLVVTFDTTWQKHIIIYFYDVIEERGLDDVTCILDSDFEIKENEVQWIILDGFNKDWDGLDDVFVRAKRIRWRVIFD